MTGNSVSWFNLLEKFARSRKPVTYNNIPMPLEFERLMNLCMTEYDYKDKSAAYSRAKGSIAKMIIKNGELNSSAIHYNLKKLDVKNIMTTNYDGLLEKVYGLTSLGSMCGKRRFCFLEPTDIDDIRGIYFYHLHGLVTKPSTICLGQIHYSRIVNMLQDDLASKKGCAKKTNSNLRILRILRGEEYSDSWGSLFFTTNVGIVGFGLADCELDIWWLLAKRASLYYQNYGGARSLINNKIVYYDVVRKAASEEERYSQEIKHLLLEGLYVSIVKVNITKANDYKKAYEAIINCIKDYGISDREKEINI